MTTKTVETEDDDSDFENQTFAVELSVKEINFLSMYCQKQALAEKNISNDVDKAEFLNKLAMKLMGATLVDCDVETPLL